jgi:hypothetical protein
MPISKVSEAGLSSGAQFNGFKNRIINGAMVIDQRNAGAAVTANGSFPVDRMRIFNSSDGAFSAQQDSSAPDGFVNSVKVTTTTADGTLTGTQNLQFTQRIEGTNVADLGWGTASAAPVTLSFWVRSSLTGTFGGSLRNSAGTRSYPYTYTISVADTWEYKTVTIAGDTSGTWLTTTGIGLIVFFGLGVGPDVSGTAGAWAGVNYLSATGAVSVIGTLNATWYVTGVQLEKGSTATSFDYRPYGTELALCQRYFEKSYEQDKSIGSSGTGNTGQTLYIGTGNIVGSGDKLPNTTFMVTKRTAPTVNTWSPNGTASTLANMAGTDLATNSCTPNVANDRSFFAFNATSSVTGSLGCVQFQWSASAEL